MTPDKAHRVFTYIIPLSIVFLTSLEIYEIPFDALFMPMLCASVYYICALLTVHFFREKFSANTFIIALTFPCILFFRRFTINKNSIKSFIVFPSQIIKTFGYLWIAGFIISLLILIAKHCIYRNNVVKNQIETNSIVLDLWNKTKTEFIANDSIEFVSKINLITSTYISSPLTIGVFDKTTIVVLPVYDYSQNELLMIFHHEINHIIARDNKTKLILNLYKSIFWFNPIIHFALKENAVNLEMRCDENTVKSSRCSKKEYLSLIINTAASNSAITSSLIADKKSLEYRIKNITQKTEKKNTIILTLIIFIVVTSTIGSLNLVYDQKACFINNDGGLELAYDSIVFNNGESIEKCNIDNIEELTNNISSLNAFRIAGIKRVRESNYISLIAKNGNKTYQLYITDNFIQSIDMNFILRSYVYYCPGLEIETLLKK